MKKIILILLSHLILTIFPIAIEFVKQDDLIITNEIYNVELIKQEENKECNKGNLFTFEVLELETNEKYSFILQNETFFIHEFYLFEEKLLIYGEFSSVHLLTIYSLKEKNIVDEIIGYHFSFSNSRKYITYIKFFPRFIDWEENTNVLLLYDVSKSPKKNRQKILESEIKDLDPVIKKNYLRENVGTPVFPQFNAQEKEIKPRIRVDNYYIIEPIVWKDFNFRFLVNDKQKNIFLVVSVFILKGNSFNVYIKYYSKSKNIIDLKEKMINLDCKKHFDKMYKIRNVDE